MGATVRPVPPFDLALSCAVFSGGDPGIRRYDGRRFTMVLRLGKGLALATVTAGGTARRPLLSVGLRSRSPPGRARRSEAGDAIGSFFNARMDPGPFLRQVRHDRPMAALAERLSGLRAPTTPTVFESLVDSIIEQQISLKVAWVLEERLVKGFGDRLDIPGGPYFIYPEPGQIASAPPERLRALGLSNRKAECIIGLGRDCARGELDLERLRRLPCEEIISVLCGRRGIGRWTAELAMLRGMGRFDALPADDLGVRRAMGLYYRKRRPPTAGEARKIAERWGDWKGLAAFYLLTAERMGIPPGRKD